MNVREKVWPLEREPESNSPVSLVTVCSVESRLVQVTEVPGATFMVCGWKEKPEMLTLAVGVEVGVGVGVGPAEKADFTTFQMFALLPSYPRAQKPAPPIFSEFT